MLNLRRVERAVAGGDPGPEGNVTKLITAEHMQASPSSPCASSAPPASTARIPNSPWWYLFNRS